MKSMSLKSKILGKLKNGGEFSPKQLASMFNVSATTVAARVSELRREGFAIYNNTLTDSQGRTSNKYRIGMPTRAIIAAGHKALGATGMFDVDQGKFLVNKNYKTEVAAS